MADCPELLPASRRVKTDRAGWGRELETRAGVRHCGMQTRYDEAKVNTEVESLSPGENRKDSTTYHRLHSTYHTDDLALLSPYLLLIYTSICYSNGFTPS